MSSREPKNNSSGAAVACLAIGFLIGRCTATPDKPVATAPLYSPSATQPESIERPSASTYPVQTESVVSAPTDSGEDVADDVYYRNCSAARAAGAAPIRAGEAGYAAHLDRDGDGVACE